MIKVKAQCHTVAWNLNVLSVTINNRTVFSIVTSGGNCHEAAYLGHILAARMAKAMGITSLTIHNTNRHVVHQLNGTWRARSAMMRRYRDLFRRLFRGMDIVHRF